MCVVCVCEDLAYLSHAIESIDSKLISVCLINDYSLNADLHIFVYGRAECLFACLLCMWLIFFMSVYLFFSDYLIFYQPVDLFICPSISLYISLSLYLSICILCVCLAVCLSNYIFFFI